MRLLLSATYHVNQLTDTLVEPLLCTVQGHVMVPYIQSLIYEPSGDVLRIGNYDNSRTASKFVIHIRILQQAARMIMQQRFHLPRPSPRREARGGFGS